jgi:HK97 family phage prohead protease
VRLSVDPKGLRYEIDVPNTTAGRDTMEYVKRGDIHESSFAFVTRAKGDLWEKRSSDGLPLRELLDVELVDVAPVIDQAAYPATQVSARTLEEAQKAVEPPPLAPGVPNEVNEARLRLQA